MENYWGGDPTTNCNVERTCHLKNMYVLDHEKADWISLPTATLSYGDGGGVLEHQKKFGAHSFGATEEFFWGSTGGKVADQEAYEKEATKYATYTINQPAQPLLGTPSIKEIRFTDRIVWEMEENSTPQLAYQLKVVDPTGKILFQKSATRPEVHSETPNKISQNDAVKCILTVTDVFGNSTTSELMTDAYQKAVAEGEDSDDPIVKDPEDTTVNEPNDTPAPAPEENIPSQNPDLTDSPKKNSSSWNPPLVIGIVSATIIVTVSATIIVTVGAVTAFLLIRKKKR